MPMLRTVAILMALVATLSVTGCTMSRSYSDGSSASSASSADCHACSKSDPYAKPGFATYEEDGRLWVFKASSKAHAMFKEHGEPAKCVTLIGEGPGGMTLKGDSKDVLISYMATKPGFYAEIVDERLWVLDLKSKAYQDFMSAGEPAKSITMIGEGPDGMSVRSDSKETFIRYLASKPGFMTAIEDGRLWILKTGSDAHKAFEEFGEPAKSVTLISEGPHGVSVRSDSHETITEWKVAAPGFATYVHDGRIWVFESGSDSEKVFKEYGEPAKSVTRIGVGPDGMTVRSDDGAVIDKYLSTLGS